MCICNAITDVQLHGDLRDLHDGKGAQTLQAR